MVLLGVELHATAINKDALLLLTAFLLLIALLLLTALLLSTAWLNARCTAFGQDLIVVHDLPQSHVVCSA